ncbi:MAG: response regulator [Gammaproteobacteria bacterium]|nr:response regulator [Gammaproteobacteria bacterium]
MIWNSVKNKPIHLITSDGGVRDQLIQLLGKLSRKVKTFENANDFINEPISEAPACLNTEIKLSDSDGITLIKQMREHGLSTPVVVIADGSHSVNTAVEAIQAGATDFIEQPIVERDFLERMQNILNTK